MLKTAGSGYSTLPIKTNFYDLVYFSCFCDIKIVWSNFKSHKLENHPHHGSEKSIFFAKKKDASTYKIAFLIYEKCISGKMQ